MEIFGHVMGCASIFQAFGGPHPTSDLQGPDTAAPRGDDGYGEDPVHQSVQQFQDAGTTDAIVR